MNSMAEEMLARAGAWMTSLPEGKTLTVAGWCGLARVYSTEAESSGRECGAKTLTWGPWEEAASASAAMNHNPRQCWCQ